MEMMEIASFSSLPLPLRCSRGAELHLCRLGEAIAVKSSCLWRVQGHPELPPSPHKNSPDVVQPWNGHWRSEVAIPSWNFLSTLLAGVHSAPFPWRGQTRLSWNRDWHCQGFPWHMFPSGTGGSVPASDTDISQLCAWGAPF